MSEEKRLCRICGKTLSAYNESDKCFCHYTYPEEVKVFLFTSGVCGQRFMATLSRETGKREE